MATDRSLIDYLPHYMQKYMEMKVVMQAEQPSFYDLWEAIDNAFADQYVMEATEYGVLRLESMLGISSKGTETLDERKFRIIARMNQELPYTIAKLNEALTNLCGANGYSISIQPEQYYIEVRLALHNESNYSEVESILKKMLPANLNSVINIKYNSHNMVGKLTHAELAAFTHDDLRKEVFE